MKHLILALFLLFTVEIQAQSFEAGLWKYQESLNLNGLALPPSSNEDCISDIQAKDAKTSIEKELKKRGCSLTKWVVKNQKLDAAISCKNETFEATGKLTGSFAPKSYDLIGQAEGTYMQALPAVANLKLSGQWVKKCIK